MSFFPDYDRTAGFPEKHIEAFKAVAKRLRMVISSRELNPCSTDLILEGYATKGLHIKAKTCDWGPAAGFVVDDPRFIKKSASPSKQAEDLRAAFADGAAALPLFISDERFTSLRAKGVVHVTGSREPDVVPVIAGPMGSTQSYKFVLTRSRRPLANDMGKLMWGVYYDPSEVPQYTASRNVCPLQLPYVSALNPVMAMMNPRDATGERFGVRSAVIGDYDLWCIFAHQSAPNFGISDRPMRLHPTLTSYSDPGLMKRAIQGRLTYDSTDKAALYEELKKKGDPHLGNISLAVIKVKAALNQQCAHKGGDVVQHGDFGGNPFGEIDYPLIFFVPTDDFSNADTMVVTNLLELPNTLKKIAKRGFVINLNPAWVVRSF